MALVALGARAGYLLAFRHSPFFEAPILDSAFHDAIARSVASGDLTAGAPWFRPPLYPWLLGALYGVFGAGPWPGRVLNLAAGVLTAVAVLGAGRQLSLGRPARLAAALVAALYAPEIFLTGELLGEPVATALGAWGLWAALRAFATSPAPSATSPRGPGSSPRPASSGFWFLASLLWSLSALARGPQAVLPLLLLVPAALGPARWRRLAAVTAGMILIWSGPAAVMATHGAGFRFPATQGGINLYVGNHPGADGRSVTVPELGTATGWVEFSAASVRVASRIEGRALGPSEASAFWARRALHFWITEPGEAIAVTARRALFLVHGFESPNNRSLYEARGDAPAWGALLWKFPGAYWPSGLIFPLALVGVLGTLRRRVWWPVLIYAGGSLLPLLAFFVCARFRVPALPALALLAVAGVTLLMRSPKRWGGVLAAAYLVANVPWAPAVAESPLGEALVRGEASLNAGDLPVATSAYRRALALSPESGRAWLGLAVVAENQGQSGEALRLLGKAQEELPGYWAVQEALGRVHASRGDFDLAIRHYSEARADFPENPRLAGELGLLLELRGRDAESRALLETAVQGGAGDAEIWNSLGRYRRLAGEIDAALAAWDRALELTPDSFKPRFNRGLARLEQGDRAGAAEDLRLALIRAPDAETATRVRALISQMGDASP